MKFFEKYLTFWVIICIVIGVIIGKYLSIVPIFLNQMEYAHISIPIAILITLMIYPMMLKIDFNSIKTSVKEPKGLLLTVIVNWLIKPFSMYLISSFFLYIIFKNIIPHYLATEYLSGLVILAAAPCTAMVFVWSNLTRGDPAYTLIQVSINNIILLFAYVPIVGLLLGIEGIIIPWNTLIFSVILYVVTPLVLSIITRILIIKYKNESYLNEVVINKLSNLTVIGLLLTLIIIFSFQGEMIIYNYTHIGLIAIPIIIQTFLMFAITYIIGKFITLPHCIASPAAMIGGSNFFELAVAVAISLFGMQSGATLATVVGVLVEVPLMLILVKISNNTAHYFKISSLTN